MKEVYVAKGVNGEILYVGQGNVGRNAHCLNGTSHNKQLNRYFFMNGEDGCITTEVLHVVDSQQDAFELEKVEIRRLNPIFNQIKYVTGTDEVAYRNFSTISFDYFISNGADPYLNIEVLETYPQIFEYVKVLGIEVLKTCGYQESKIRNRYESQLKSYDPKYERRVVQEHLNFKVDDKYTSKQLKDLFAECFKSLGVNKASKASCVLDYYSVGRANINGCRGYKILGKLS